MINSEKFFRSLDFQNVLFLKDGSQCFKQIISLDIQQYNYTTIQLYNRTTIKLYNLFRKHFSI